MNKSELATLIATALNTQKGTTYTASMITAAFDNNDGTFQVCTNDDYIYTVTFEINRTDVVTLENEMLRNLPDDATVILSQPNPNDY